LQALEEEEGKEVKEEKEEIDVKSLELFT